MKEIVINLLKQQTKIPKEKILSLLEIPKDPKLGDYAFPCFTLAKQFRKNPADIAKDIVHKMENILEFEKVEAIGGYVNIFVNRTVLAEETLEQIQKEKNSYGSSNLGKGKRIVIDMSSPNIAKPFGIGHLRSTIIGNSLASISSFLGFKTTKINYLGDWGTQFGKLIVGYTRFGNKEKLKKSPMTHLLELYVKVNEDETLDEASRAAFRDLENGDKNATKLWKLFKEISLKEFDKIYKIINIKFDVTEAESEYAWKKKNIILLLKRKNLLEMSENAAIVNLEKYGLGVALIEKADSASLYTTRELAAAIDRHKKYKFNRMLYETGSEQKLHFSQIFKLLELLGYDWAKNCVHVDHGLYLDNDGKKFATRKGKTVFMLDILNETQELAKSELQKRYKLQKKEIERRANAIANAAIFYGDLKNYRANNMVFDIERFVSFEGNTGPYLLYAYARARSILRKAKYKQSGKYKIHDLSDMEKSLVFQLSNFPNVVIEAYNGFAPNIIANYAFQLAQLFNEFYHSNPVIGSENEQFRLALVGSFSQVLKNALDLLGISVLEEM